MPSSKSVRLYIRTRMSRLEAPLADRGKGSAWGGPLPVDGQVECLSVPGHTQSGRHRRVDPRWLRGDAAELRVDPFVREERGGALLGQRIRSLAGLGKSYPAGAEWWGVFGFRPGRRHGPDRREP